MEIKQANISRSPVISLSSQGPKVQNLVLGQLLNATVVSNRGGELQLNINNAVVNAQSKLDLLPGQLLQLVVAQTGKQTLLQLSAKSADQAVLAQALRLQLPKQIPQQELLRTLNTIVSKPETVNTANLPLPIQSLARQIVQRLPTEKTVTNAESLKQVLLNAGGSLENKLNRPDVSNSAINNDFKTQLLRLQASLASHINRPEISAIEAIQKLVRQNPEQLTTLQTALQKFADTPAISQLSNMAADAKLPVISQRLEQLTQLVRQVVIQLNPTNVSAPAAIPIETKIAELLTDLFKQLGMTQQMLNQSPLAKNSLTKDLASNLLGLRTQLHQLLNPSAEQAQQQTKNAARSGVRTEPNIGLQEFLRQTEGAVARMQTQQINTLAEQETGKLNWTFEIPVNVGKSLELLKMRIQGDEENGKEKEGSHPLTVTLHLNLPSLGPVYARLQLIKDIVSVTFWSQNSETNELTRETLPELEARLTEAGLKPQNLVSLIGIPPHERESDIHELTSHLLDIKA